MAISPALYKNTIYVPIQVVSVFLTLFSCMHNLIYIPFSSLEEIWVTVLNITGPLSSWSFADNVIPGRKPVSSIFLRLITFFSLHNFVCINAQEPKLTMEVHHRIYCVLVDQATGTGLSG